jgi:hypothetical protein
MNASKQGHLDEQLVRRADFIASLREAAQELFGDAAWSAIYGNAMRRLELKTVQRETQASGWET